MAPKINLVKGIILIVDVGKAVRSSTEITFYAQAKQCLLSILQRKIFSATAKDIVGIILIGTDGTKNKFAVSLQYQHISVIQELKVVDWDMVKLAENIERGNSEGDWLDAIVVGMDLLHENIGCIYSSRQIVLMTDFNMEFNDDKADVIIQNLKEMKIDFNVIGPSLDEEDDGDSPMPSTSKGDSQTVPLNWNGKPKTKQQLAAETVLKRILLQVDGKLYSFDEAIPQLLFYEKNSQASANWNSLLSFGNNLKIPIIGRIKIKQATIPAWKKACVKDESAAILSEVSYTLRDEDQTKIDEDDVIPGYKYGSTIVPMAKTDRNTYKSNAACSELSILTFSPASSIPLNLRAGDQVLVVTAREHDSDAALGLSALLRAMHELDMVAITRRIYRKNANPLLGALIPEVTDSYECFLWIGLPFHEDIRSYIFPSLSSVQKVITDSQRDQMDQFIDSMMLESNEEDDEEEFDPANILNPQLQHFYNCITQRALYPDLPVPAPLPSVLDILKQNSSQTEAVSSIIESLKKLFPTEKKIIKENPKDLLNNGNMDLNKPSTSTGHSVALTMAELVKSTVTKITTVSPAKDFLAMLKSSQPDYNNICDQMEDAIFQLVDQMTSSVAADEVFLERISDALQMYRREATEIDPTKFNKFIKNIKSAVKTRSLTNLWLVVTNDKLGIISCKETLKSNYSEDEASEFYEMQEPVDQAAVNQEQDSADYEDMIDDL